MYLAYSFIDIQEMLRSGFKKWRNNLETKWNVGKLIFLCVLTVASIGCPMVQIQWLMWTHTYNYFGSCYYFCGTAAKQHLENTRVLVKIIRIHVSNYALWKQLRLMLMHNIVNWEPKINNQWKLSTNFNFWLLHFTIAFYVYLDSTSAMCQVAKSIYSQSLTITRHRVNPVAQNEFQSVFDLWVDHTRSRIWPQHTGNQVSVEVRETEITKTALCKSHLKLHILSHKYTYRLTVLHYLRVQQPLRRMFRFSVTFA